MGPRQPAAEETCMADTMGHSPGRSASTVRNTSAAIAVLVLALTPQLLELLWSIGAQLAAFAGIAKYSGRGLLQVLSDHGSALLLAAPQLGSGTFGGGAKLSFFFSSRRRHTRLTCDWSSDVCSSD